MKYAIYDKAADGYLTSMEFDTDLPDNYTRYACGYNEYITEARLLDTPKEAADAIVRIESCKFMDKGRFVVHSFDDTLKDQYIISEAGEPTKVVDNITVNLDGTIDVKYGTMPLHWSATSLDYAVNRMLKLQNALNPNVYTSWYDTFDIYKVITVIDEKSYSHYQFIKVTEKGLEDYKKNEERKLLVSGKDITDVTDLLNKRIEELEKANYELGEQVAERGAVANRLQEENDKLEAKVESIKEEARNWKSLYENADVDREELKNVIDIIHTDLVSTTACNDLKDTLKAIYHNSGLDHISMENFLTAKDEICSIINHVITIMESREFNQNVAFSSAEEMTKAKDIAEKVIDICDSNDDFTVQLYKFSKLYATIDNISKTTNSSLMMAFNKFLALMSTANKSLDKILGDNIDMMIKWRSESEKLRKDLENQKELNNANKATIARLTIEKRNIDKNTSNILKEETDWKRRAEEAIRDYTKCNEALGEWKRKCKAKDTDYEMLKNKLKAFEIILESTQASLTVTINERDKALERAEKFKGIANSIYGMTIPGRCCGKQMIADVINGKKIFIDKKKYDDLVGYIDNINLTYDAMFPMMDKPVYLSIISEGLHDLTK